MIVCLQFEGNCTLKIAEFDCYDRSKRIRSPISFLVKDPALYKGHFQLNDHFAESIRWNEWNDRFKYTILRFWNLTIISLKIYNNWIQSIRSLWSYNFSFDMKNQNLRGSHTFEENMDTFGNYLILCANDRLRSVKIENFTTQSRSMIVCILF